MDSEDTKKFLNYCCVKTFITVGKNKLHEIFRKRWHIYKKQIWVDDGTCNSELVKLSESQAENFPKQSALHSSMKGTLTTCNLDRWDITATSYAIQVISNECKGVKFDAKEETFVHAIRKIRNEISHEKDDSQLSEDERKAYMNQLTNAYTKFGMNKTEVYKEKEKAMQKAGILGVNNVQGIENEMQTTVHESTFEADADVGETESESEYDTCESEFDDDSTVETSTVDTTVKSTPNETLLPQLNNAKREYERLKDEANKLFKANDYNKAISIYEEILQLPNLSQDDQAIIFSNRSAAHLLLKNEESYRAAKEDAEWAIQLWPCWWRGYYRLARAQVALHELTEAEKSLKKALALNKSAKDAIDELSDVRSKLGILSREEHLKPGIIPPSNEEQISDIQVRFGLSRKGAEKLSNKSKNMPPKTDVERGNRCKDQEDYVKAAAYYVTAARAGNTEAMYELGKLHNEGKGVKRDYEEAFKLLMKAATTKGDLLKMEGSKIPDAQHLLGMKYYDGIGVEKDYKKAYEWFEKAFNNGCAASGNNIGILYKNGYGVERSETKAFQWFKASANLGDTQGMQNLAYCYFSASGIGTFTPTREHISEGMKLLKQAANNGDRVAEREYEKRRDHTYQQFLFDAFGNMIISDPSNECVPLDQNQHKKSLKEAAKNGSITSKQMLDIYANEERAIEAFKKNDSAGVVAALSKAIRINPEVVQVPDLLKPVIEERIKIDPEDLDTITTFVQLNSTSSLLPELIDKYLPKFPEDEYLLEMQISSYKNMKENANALKAAYKAVQLYPNSLRFLDLHAECLCLEDKATEAAVKALDKFLAAAPKDHPKVPACHYRKSRCFYVAKDMEKYLECFEAGLAAEKKQLSCFMPYSFPNKELLEKIFMHEKQKLLDSKQLASSSSANSTLARSLEFIKQNPQRKLFFSKHREFFSMSADKLLGTGYITSLTLEQSSEVKTKLQKLQKLRNLNTLKKITLKDMDPTVDKIYDGFKLEAKIIEYGFLLGAIVTIIEDENGDLQRLSIYNWPLKNVQVLDFIYAVKTFRPNVKLTIINPYMRMSLSGESAIRVDKPEFLKLDDENADKKCTCCGKEIKLTPCKNCQTSRYCSTECQKYDLNALNHNKICQHLKTCSKF